jgi:CheY-like chemotaxis protein
MKKKVLIADSDFINIKNLGKFFFEKSFSVLVATTTEQTIKIAEAKMPDIILSALTTPAVNGVEISRALKSKKKTASIPVLFISEKKDEKLVELNYSKSEGHYILKPYSTEELLNKVILLTGNQHTNNKTSPSKTNPYTILVVDDIEVNRNLIEDLLSDSSFKILKSPSGKDSIKKIKENKIDLILLDIEMPIMDGWKTIGQYKKMKLKIPVLAMSAHEDKEFKTKCHQFEFNGIVSKPINRNELIYTLKKILKLPDAKNEPEKKQPSKQTKNKNNSSLIDISKLLKVSENDIDLRISTYKKFSENLKTLLKLFENKNAISSTNETFRRELHTFINLANYFCTSKIVKKAKNMEYSLKNNLNYFNQHKNKFALLLKDIEQQAKGIELSN